MNDDWKEYFTFAQLLNGGVAYGNNGHSVKIDGITREWVSDNRYRITFTTSEKYRDSGVYSRSFTKTVTPDAEVEFDLFGDLNMILHPNNLAEFHSIDGETVNKFYRPQ